MTSYALLLVLIWIGILAFMTVATYMAKQQYTSLKIRKPNSEEYALAICKHALYVGAHEIHTYERLVEHILRGEFVYTPPQTEFFDKHGLEFPQDIEISVIRVYLAGTLIWKGEMVGYIYEPDLPTKKPLI